MIKNRKKGITLSEICIVLAVLSIVSLAIVSYAAMATGRGISGADKLKVMQDIELLEAMVDDWFDRVCTVDNKPEIDAGSNDLLKIDDDTKLSWSNGNLYVWFSAEDIRTYRFETVDSVQFEVVQSENDEIFFCTVKYAYRLGQSKEQTDTYTFCINPRVGESILK